MSRIQAMLCLYFFALLVQTLLERELRCAMQDNDVESLPQYPERRACKRPTTRRLIEIFEPLQRHELSAGGRTETFVTDLSRLHRRILTLLNMPREDYGLQTDGRPAKTRGNSEPRVRKIRSN